MRNLSITISSWQAKCVKVLVVEIQDSFQAEMKHFGSFIEINGIMFCRFFL